VSESDGADRAITAPTMRPMKKKASIIFARPVGSKGLQQGTTLRGEMQSIDLG